MVRLMKSQDDHRHHHYHHLHVDIDIIPLPHLHLHLPIPLHLHLLNHLRPMGEDHIGVLIPLLILLLVQSRINLHQPTPQKDRCIPLPITRFQPPLLSGQYIIPEPARNHDHNQSLVKFTQNHIHTQVRTKIISENDLSEVVLLAHPFIPPLLAHWGRTVHTVLTAPLGAI